jgi:Voltage gated chloride channel
MRSALYSKMAMGCAKNTNLQAVPGKDSERSVNKNLQTVPQRNRENTTTTGREEELGDFSTTFRVLPISGLAVVIGAICAFVALALLRLIGLFTNVFYFGRWSTTMVSPVGNHLGWFSLFVPIGGAFIIGIMARYGSERIRGHGIPEAIEAILINGSRVEPKVALLNPLSSAISIGSGGPFGAEGPITHAPPGRRTPPRTGFESAVLPARRKRGGPDKDSSNSLIFSIPSFLYGMPAKEKIHE